MTQESTRSCIQTFLRNFNLFAGVHVNIRTQHFPLNLSVSKELCPAPLNRWNSWIPMKSNAKMWLVPLTHRLDDMMLKIGQASPA